MALDKSVAERRRFALLLGTAPDHGSGLPVGPSTAGDSAVDSARRDDAAGHADTPAGTGGEERSPHRDATADSATTGFAADE